VPARAPGGLFGGDVADATDFDIDLRASESGEAVAAFEHAARQFWPGATWRHTEAGNPNGDWRVCESTGHVVLVEQKHRRRGAVQFWPAGCGSEDVALEYESVVVVGQVRRVGWAMDLARKTDHVVFTFADRPDTQYRVSFPSLVRLCLRYMDGWRLRYRCAKQRTRRAGAEWESACCFVPIAVLLPLANRECA